MIEQAALCGTTNGVIPLSPQQQCVCVSVCVRKRVVCWSALYLNVFKMHIWLV